jgi:hypothetical protein
MYNTKTNTSTYTVTDIRRTFEGFGADLRMIAGRTEKWTDEYVKKVFHDILQWAENGYLSSVDIVLLNSHSGEVVKATKFKVNPDGTARSSQRAGKNNDWPNSPNTKLSVIVNYTPAWQDISDVEQSKFQTDRSFQADWSSTSIDNSFPHLRRTKKQLYASKGYELQKSDYE